MSILVPSPRLFVPLAHSKIVPHVAPGTLTPSERLQERLLHLRTFFWEVLKGRMESGAAAPTCDKVSNGIVESLPDHIERFVDMGCGTGPVLRALLRSGKLAKNGIAIGVDLKEDFAKYAAKTIRDDRVQIYCADGRELPRITDQAFGPGKKAQGLTVTTPMSKWEEDKQVGLFEKLYESVEDDGPVILAIFNEMRELFVKVTGQEPTVSEIKGQLIPPWLYFKQTVHKSSIAV